MDMMAGWAWRVVVWGSSPKRMDLRYSSFSSLDETPGEPRMSSALPAMPSLPGWTPTRGSVPELAWMWHEPHDMVLSLESWASQKRALPSVLFSTLNWFSGGNCTGGSPPGPGWARAGEGRIAATAKRSGSDRAMRWARTKRAVRVMSKPLFMPRTGPVRGVRDRA